MMSVSEGLGDESENKSILVDDGDLHFATVSFFRSEYYPMSRVRSPLMCLFLAMLLVLWLPCAQAVDASKEVHIGVLSFRPLEDTKLQWQATAEYLSTSVAGEYHFSIEPLYFAELDKAIDNGRFEFILTNPDHYITIRSLHGLAAVATLMPFAVGHPVDQFGGVILARSNNIKVNNLDDLRGKVVASVAEISFGSYLVQRWTMFKQGIQIGEVKKVLFTGMPQDKVVMAVLSGDADVGFVRTGVLEGMALEGKINLDEIKVINLQPKGDFPQLLSTELYPEWPFSARTQLPEALVKQVTLALLNIKPGDRAAKSGQYFGFSPPGNYAPVEAVMLRLKMNPDRFDQFDLQDVLRKYEMPLFAGTLLMLLSVLAAALYLMRTNLNLQASYRESARLDRELQHANATLETKVAERTRQLQESERRFRAILQTSPIAVRIAVDGGHQVVFANSSYETLIGVEVGKALGANPQSYYAHPEEYQAVLLRLAAKEQISDVLMELAIPNRGTRWTLASYVTFLFEGQDAVLGWFYDITPLKHAEQALQQSEARFRQMFENHASPMLMVNPGNGEIVSANQAAANFYGYTVKQLSVMNIAQINMQSPQLLAEERQQALNDERNYFIFPHRLSGGEIRTVEVHSSPVEVEGRSLLFSIIHDITDRKRLEEEMHGLAFYDSLTKLPNRRLLLDRLGHSLLSASRSKRHGALMFLDLDNFKTLNDQHGHDVGDLLLIEVANRILACIRSEDSVSRFGGDEFVVLLDGLSEKLDEAVMQAETVAEKIRRALSEPYQLRRHGLVKPNEAITHHCSSSIGVTVFRDSDQTVEQLLKWTDMAMYRAKDAGRNVIRFFDPSMQIAIETRFALEADLRVALEQGQFKLLYQVQVNANGKPQGAEVLLRWQHPKRGLVSPAEFIPLAEETGLILPIGAWVLDTACAQLKLWESQIPFRNLSLAVNVSAKQFRQTDFVEQVEATVKKYGINPLSIKLELTESLVLDNVEDTILKMNILKEFGVTFSMDDFGTGYSSLSYLKRLPLDQLKIDQSFVRNLTTDKADMVMVMAIVDLGMNFEVNVIAEGVETEAQFKLLHRYGCGNFQGYLFSKPISVEQFEAWVVQRLVS
jgi:diguanylate cyclase (GGDEF)-like protein/PAS domain S-box-containing protein